MQARARRLDDAPAMPLRKTLQRAAAARIAYRENCVLQFRRKIRGLRARAPGERRRRTTCAFSRWIQLAAGEDARCRRPSRTSLECHDVAGHRREHTASRAPPPTRWQPSRHGARPPRLSPRRSDCATSVLTAPFLRRQPGRSLAPSVSKLRTTPITRRTRPMIRPIDSRCSRLSDSSMPSNCASARRAANGLFSLCWTCAVRRCNSVEDGLGDRTSCDSSVTG